MLIRTFANLVEAGGRKIGPGHPVFIMAEAGPNHNGDLKRALRMIDDAAAAGCDAVKFQTFTAEGLYSHKVKTMDYLYEKGVLAKGETVLDMFRPLELPREWHKILADRCRERNVAFLSTPFDLAAVDELAAVDCPAYKIASYEIVHLPLLRACAQTGRPILLSTGMASLGDIELALETIWEAGGRQVLLFHCAIAYPPRFADCHLHAIETLMKAFGTPVGWSDHTTGWTCDVAAVALGACAIEKHYTLDKTLPGPDHYYALTPPELRSMVHAIRETEQALGGWMKGRTPAEEEMYTMGRRSIIAARAVRKGQTIVEQDLIVKRPGYGIHPQFLNVVVGRTAQRDIEADDILTWDMV